MMTRRRAWAAGVAWLAAAGCDADSGGKAGRIGEDTATPSSTGAPVGTTGGTPTGSTTSAPDWGGHAVAAGDAVGVRSALPASNADCWALGEATAPCGDVDLDGLTDAWEDLVLGLLRPAIRFDEAEPLVDDPAAVLVDVGRVAPADDGSGAIRVYVMIGYHQDYGRCAVSAHHGDSERVVIDLEPIAAGDADALGFYTAAHEGTITDSGHVFRDAELAELSFPADPTTAEPRWMIFSSDGKHASYGTVQRCEDAQWAPCLEEDCDADGVDPGPFTRLPEVFNAGEEGAPRLTDLAPVGFPGEDAWAEQDFCGGLGADLLGCAAPVREKLLVDPFL